MNMCDSVFESAEPIVNDTAHCTDFTVDKGHMFPQQLLV